MTEERGLKRNSRFIRNVALDMLDLEGRESNFKELADDRALIPRRTGSYAEKTNNGVRNLMQRLKMVLYMYEQQPPTQTGGG